VADRIVGSSPDVNRKAGHIYKPAFVNCVGSGEFEPATLGGLWPQHLLRLCITRLVVLPVLWLAVFLPSQGSGYTRPGT
jgi:hypothetical protein